MNQPQLISLCQILDLGDPLLAPIPVTGGLLHKMYRIITNVGQYAVKELNPVVKTQFNIKAKYRVTEEIALQMLQQGIPAIIAYRDQGEPIIEVGSDWFMVFDWVDAQTLTPDQVEPYHAQKIGEILFAIHDLKIPAEHSEEPLFDYYTDDHWVELIEKVCSNSNFENAPLANSLEPLLPDIISLNQQFLMAGIKLKDTLLISHADLDPKNVLWKDNIDPKLIDWESTRPVNPTLEVIACALDWSGITVGEVNINLYKALIRGYQSSGGKLANKDIRNSFYGLAGNWLAWLEFNIRRALGECTSNKEEQRFGAKMAIETVGTLMRLKNNVDKFIGYIHANP
jgi:thiamine kinase-like enzyme